ncbi:ATP-binding cassette domain-containing protein [Candidatus Peregrinibacteria bacterium]|jgi:cell division transport system ATP-binding protein|nr:ATP-binding cassette domain-containing protein [Candidatus Peregrinibacteria bacterium]
MIEFKNATKQYGERLVLDNVNLQIQGGDWVWLMGPSGSGKTTLVLSLIGAVSLTHGNIIVDRYDLTKFNQKALQEYRRRLGIVFQDYKLLPKKTAYENVAFAMEACGYSEDQIKKRVDEVLEKVGLAAARHHFPHMLSGGEKQRVAIARALIHEPRLLIADEPTGNLDPKTAAGIVDLFQKLNIEGVTVIFATHNGNLLRQVNGKVLYVEEGKIRTVSA